MEDVDDGSDLPIGGMPASLVDKRCCLIISRIQVEHNKRERERARGPRFKVFARFDL